LISLSLAFVPSSSAGLLKNTATLKLALTDSQAASEMVVPLGGAMNVDVQIGYLVSGLFATQAINLYQQRQIPASIHLSVEETPSFCTATIQPNVVTPEIKKGYSYDNATLRISFKEEAPAMGEVKIKIRMHADMIPGLLFQINEATFIGEIAFMPAYLPIISVTPQGNFLEISPGEVARFDIEIENLGNAKTVVDFTILNFPKDWSPKSLKMEKLLSNFLFNHLMGLDITTNEKQCKLKLFRLISLMQHLLGENMLKHLLFKAEVSLHQDLK